MWNKPSLSVCDSRCKPSDSGRGGVNYSETRWEAARDACEQLLSRCRRFLPSSAFFSHSTNFFICSRKMLLPLVRWPSEYHFSMASSLRTSAVEGGAGRGVNERNVQLTLTLCLQPAAKKKEKHPPDSEEATALLELCQVESGGSKPGWVRNLHPLWHHKAQLKA